jgi:endonuclease YncB( thermonuclease family)
MHTPRTTRLPRHRRAYVLETCSIFALLVLSLAPASSAGPQTTFTGRVVGVLDGDSLVVLHEGREVQVRLHGVDAPESGQAFGNVSKRALSNLVFGTTVTVTVVDIDQYQRRVSRVTAGGSDVGLALIQSGFAWHYRRYLDDERYAMAEQSARRARRGLWQDTRPVAPWAYRQSRSTRPRR